MTSPRGDGPHRRREPTTLQSVRIGDPPTGRLALVLCNAPRDDAERIARAVVERRLAACVNVVPGVVSFYWWDGKLERDEECTLLVKTRHELVAPLTDAIEAIHPYEVPEVIAVPIEVGQGNPAYAAWVAAETRDAPVSSNPSSGGSTTP